ncbi:esterase-like activity of phytase family protein [Actinocorallia sp. API 0066]|uniref:esterase-like activity of phytase family protein n=1 Tax=Actinocorallia sp. API 0066 TaxID=2896846 RepID=UPI001E48391B|nr:esterase-like activity of phytase family protein [Actinocorallia sp. API 0066]MCD0452177.1 esterase-like activity of phytase family protein [Actinocorallia sp. API 0066]
MRLRMRWTAGALASAAVITGLAPAAHAGGGKHPLFERIATYPVFQNLPKGVDPAAETVAEISAVTPDGKTLIYTDAPGSRVGFLDLSNPARPRGLGTLATAGGQPTSVAVVGGYALVVIDAAKSFTAPSGRVDVVRIADRRIVRSIDLGGQPDSIAVRGKYAAIAIENQRDEEATPPGGKEGDLPQAPAGFLQILDLKGSSPAAWKLRKVAFTRPDGSALPSFKAAGLAAPADPEPEYVTINAKGKVAVTLQENNGIAVVDLRSGRIEKVFSAGRVTVKGIDVKEDGVISPTGTIRNVPREPDAISWVDDTTLATANEGDWKGGSRGWTVFNAKTGKVLWDAGNSFERLALKYGHFNEDRSENKGTEPEGLTVATIKGKRYAFVGSERSNFVAVYNVDRPARPRFIQFLPTNAGPEGLLAVPSRGLFIVSSENDDAKAGVRAGVQVFRIGRPSVPGLASAPGKGGAPIGWGALSGLSSKPGSRDGLYAVSDNAYKPTKIYTINTGRTPALITSALTVTKKGKPAAYDAEGIAARPSGGFWLAHEGAKGPENLLVRVSARGAVQKEIALPAAITSRLGAQGLEGVTVTGKGRAETVWVTLQRPLTGDPANVVRIGRYVPATGKWSWFGYPIAPSASETNWNGLSEITAYRGRLVLVERDKASGTLAKHKKLYTVAIPKGTPKGLPVLKKTLLRDLLPDLASRNGWIQEKVEGFAVTSSGRPWIVTDNDATQDATGETLFLPLPRL